MSTLAYARVSTNGQTNDRQLDALKRHGYDQMWQEKISGGKKASERPALSALLDYARPGDTVLVSSFDRLGRSLLHCLETANKLTEREILLKSLKEGIDYSTSHGRLMAGIFGAFAEYERVLINERAAEAREAARVRGKHIGPPHKLTSDQRRQIRSLRTSGESIADLCKSFGCSRATLYRALREVSAE